MFDIYKKYENVEGVDNDKTFEDKNVSIPYR